MRHNVAISTLFACLTGVFAADETTRALVFNDFSPPPGATYPVYKVVDKGTQPFTFDTNYELSVKKIRLRRYSNSTDADDDQIVSEQTIAEPQKTREHLNLGRGIQSPFPKSKPGLSLKDKTITVQWTGDGSDYFNQLLYLECEWSNSTFAGNSTSEIFVTYSEDGDVTNATSIYEQSDRSRPKNSGTAEAVRIEHVMPISSAPSPTNTAETTPSTPTASNTVGLGTPTTTPTTTPTSTPNKAGLTQGATIGIAVGVSIAGLIIAGVLGWFFCFRRRRSQKTSKTHHMMQSYSSDVGGQAMMADKETPVVLEATAPQYADGSRPSGDVYAPYSDRSTASPVPQATGLSEQQQNQHHRTTSSNVISSAAAAVPVSPSGASETDVSWGRGAPTPTSVIASRYAHLVEEGMTEDEIRRLEEEERQLDAAIENAGRRGHSHNQSS